MDVVLVLGKRLRPDGSLSDEFKVRLAKAFSLLSHDPDAILVITGGVTRAGFPAEAVAAWDIVPDHYRNRTFLEKESRTTAENVRYTRKLLAYARIDHLTVITTCAHVPRARLLFKRNWPEPKATFESFGSSGIRSWVTQTVRYLLALVDREDRLVQLTKRMIRYG